MTVNFPAATRFALLLAAGAVAGLLADVSAANAETAKRRHTTGQVYRYSSNGPNVSYQQGPRTRIYVSKRSWLDGGTEVLPGDRKFTDYAFPPEMGFPSFARQNGNRPIDRQPLNPPWDLGGEPTRFPLYP